MVARINTGKNISKALNNNEQKVALGKAEILLASGFLKDADKLSFYDKMEQFERHISLNERAVINSLHISLNFSPEEKISNVKMMEIAEIYLEKIGFVNQPYLVYRHEDAGHSHMHIVNTNIKAMIAAFPCTTLDETNLIRPLKEVSKYHYFSMLNYFSRHLATGSINNTSKVFVTQINPIS